MIGISVPHEDAAKVGMVFERNTHEIPDFAFLPVGTAIQIRDGGDGFSFVDADLKGNIDSFFSLGNGVEDFKARIGAEVVNRAEIDQDIESQGFTDPAEGFVDVGGANDQRLIAPEGNTIKDNLAEMGDDLVGCLRLGGLDLLHGHE